MKSSKEIGFDGRLTAAANARKVQLEKFLAKSAANDPAAAKRQSDREAVAIARDIRVAARKAARQESEARATAETAAHAAALAVEQSARDAAAAEQAVRDAAGALVLAAEQKIARDARYAARQARGRK
jgi:hypothetical protein